MEKVELTKKIFIKGAIQCKSGLHIGGSDQALSIGGVDNVVVRDPLTNVPYIPGSSIKGKMRSLLEKLYGLQPNSPSGKPFIYVPDKNAPPQGIMIGKLFGVPAESDLNEPSRIIVRDAFIKPESKKELEKLETDLPYSEVKTEVTINRLTSKANPRQMERVPAGTKFGFEIIVNIYEGDDEKEILKEVFKGMMLVQDDFLGGSGSRGYGKVKFNVEELSFRTKNIYKELGDKEKYTDLEIPKELRADNE